MTILRLICYATIFCDYSATSLYASLMHSSRFFPKRSAQKLVHTMPPAECEGEFHSGRPCTLGKNGKVQLHGNGKCRKCHEKRCRSHCRCARTGLLQGRARGRARANLAVLGRAKAAARPPPPPPAPPPMAPLALVGRPAALNCEVLDKPEWWDRILQEVELATHVVIASLCFDHAALHACLLRRLRGRRPLTLTVLLDKESFEEATCVKERRCLAELLGHPAKVSVHLCRGEPGRRWGRFHAKAVVVDGRTVFCGSSNLTVKSSTDNFELCFRLVGPPVEKVLQQLGEAQSRGQRWHG
jgi:hypothetical protein